MPHPDDPTSATPRTPSDFAAAGLDLMAAADLIGAIMADSRAWSIDEANRRHAALAAAREALTALAIDCNPDLSAVHYITYGRAAASRARGLYQPPA